jgi:hypothetical protein
MLVPMVALTPVCSQPPDIFPLLQHSLTLQIVSDLIATTGRRFYQRLFPLLVTQSVRGFILQRLNPERQSTKWTFRLRGAL